MGLVRSLSLTFVAQVAAQVLGIVTGFLLVRFMDKEVKGPYDWILQAPPLLMALCNLGFSSAMTFLGSSRRAGVAALANLGLTLAIGVGATAALIALPYLLANRFDGVPAWLVPVTLTMVPLLLVRSYLNTVLLIVERIARYNVVEVILPLTFFGLVLIILGPLHLQDRPGNLVIGCILARVAAVATAAITAAFYVTRFMKLRFGFDRALLRQSWERGRWAYGVQAITELNARVGMVVLLPVLLAMSLRPDTDTTVAAELGLFGLALTFADLLRNLPLAVEPVLFRRIAGASDDSTRFTPVITRNLLLLGLLAGAGVVMVAPLVIEFVNPTYHDSIRPLYPLTVGTIALCITRTLHADLMGRGRMDLPFWNTLGGFVMLTLSSIVLVPRLGILGMGCAMGLAQTLQAIVGLIIYRRLAAVPLTDLLIPKAVDLELYGRATKLLRRGGRREI